MALNLYLTVRAELGGNGLEVDPASTDYTSARVLIEEAAAAWIPVSGGVRIHVRSEVPVGRGLGASAALRVGVIRTMSALAGVDLSKDELLKRVYELEHHPDNASPAIFGGFTVSGRAWNDLRCHRFGVDSKLKAVTLVPDFEMPTGEARQLLPNTYSRTDATHSLNRAALVTAAFAQGRYELLRGVFDDVLHQPYREKLIPQLRDVVKAGEEAGAIGGFLSGAGSAIICLTQANAERIAEAMCRVVPTARTLVLCPVNQGEELILL